MVNQDLITGIDAIALRRMKEKITDAVINGLSDTAEQQYHEFKIELDRRQRCYSTRKERDREFALAHGLPLPEVKTIEQPKESWVVRLWTYLFG